MDNWHARSLITPCRAARLLDRVQQIRAAGHQGALPRPHLSRRRCDRRRGALADPDDAARDAGLCRGDGRVGPMDAGRHRAGDDRAQRAGRACLLCRAARHDQPPAQGGAAGRRRLHLLARRRADDRGGRSRRGFVRDGPADRRPRCADRGDFGPARQCLGAHGSVDRRLHRLPDQPASRHARARRRGGRRDPRDAGRRQAAARLHSPADRAADGDDADRRGSLRRDDRFRPAPHDPRDHERLGDGRVCLCRHRQKRPDRGGNGAPRPAGSRERWPARSPNSAGPTGNVSIRG